MKKVVFPVKATFFVVVHRTVADPPAKAQGEANYQPVTEVIKYKKRTFPIPETSFLFSVSTLLLTIITKFYLLSIAKKALSSVASSGFILPASTRRSCLRRKAPSYSAFSSSVSAITPGTLRGLLLGSNATNV
ncbi:hypothetical protein SAMN05421788_1119 [Filimonas lacunae]|uniref:Uncharacterized protein n=1 Tax=Filimonas lacunae TaxID=477680 RepID=A0A1N7RA99_9BACT|nr:hypothetical protein SAMN05421788_1119 [Filimonas lacunae]